MLIRSLLSICLLVLIVTATPGCGKRYKLKHQDLTANPAWPFERRTPDARGAFLRGSFGGRLNVLWEAKMGGKQTGPLTIYNNTVMLPETRKRIRVYDRETGDYLGKIKTKGVPQTGLVATDTLAFYAVGPRKNKLKGHDLTRRKTIWERDLRDVLPGPILLDDRLLASSTEGQLVAYAIEDGSSLWRFDAEYRFSASPSLGEGRLFQPADHGWLYAVNPDDGSELYRVKLHGAAVSVVAVDKLVFVADVLGTVYALKPDDGSVVWETKLDGPIWSSPAVARGRLFVGDAGGDILSLDASDGRHLWRYETNEAIKASPVVIGNFVAAATMRGTVVLLRADDGTLVDSATVEGAVAYGPVTDGQRLYLATQRGRLVCFGEKHESRFQANQGVHAQH